MIAIKTTEAKREDLEPGEFRGRVLSIDGRQEHSPRWCDLLGFRDVKHAAECMGIDHAELAFEGSVARVEVEDHAGVAKQFDVTLRIKSWGEVAEVSNEQRKGQG